MADIFLKFVNMSIAASWLILVVVIFRLLFRRAPKWVNPILWGIVGLRLIMPFSIESTLSLIPSPESISPEIMYAQRPIIHSGISAVNNLINPIISDAFAPNPVASANPLQILIPVAAIIWAGGIVLMLLYTGISYLQLHKRIITSVPLRDNIYQSENVGSPFVLGLLHPRIYLPFNMTDKDMVHVIAHEQTHIRRHDHWMKPLGFLLLSLYWFNPVMWIAYILFCRDVELACDERVIKQLGTEQRADYSEALLACSVSRRIISACPLAFGEVSVKERVKKVLNYKKPAFWIVVVALFSCIVVAVCFLTNPKSTSLSSQFHFVTPEQSQNVESITIQTGENEYVYTETEDIKAILSAMQSVTLSKTSISRSRSEDRPKYYTVTINSDTAYHNFHFNKDISEVWTNDDVKPSFSYGVTNIGDLKKWFFPCTSREWIDYFSHPAEMKGTKEINLPEYPGVTFRWSKESVQAVTDSENVELYTGMPIWNVFFCDLTGDGKPELCSTISFGSGVIDNRILIYDYAERLSYVLEDRGKFDYSLRLENGRIYVDKKSYNKDELVETGYLSLDNGYIEVVSDGRTISTVGGVGDPLTDFDR